MDADIEHRYSILVLAPVAGISLGQKSDRYTFSVWNSSERLKECVQLKEESTVDRPVSRQESRYNREVRRCARRSFKLNSLRTSLCIGQRISKSHETSSPEFRATMLIATMRSNVTGTP